MTNEHADLQPRTQPRTQPPAPEDRTEALGTERIGKLLWEFSVPSIIAMLANSLYNIIDTVFLQIALPQVGAAVTQLAYPVMCVLMAFSMLAGIGGNALAAIELGKGNRAKVERILANTAVLLFALGLLAALAGTVFITPLLALLGTTDELWAPTHTFVQIICVGFAFQSLGMGMNNFLRTAGRPNLALGTSMLGTVSCVILNAALVLGAGWGIAGSAYATVLGQLVAMVPVLWFFAKSPRAPFRFHAANFRPDVRLMGSIMALGLASFVMQVAGGLVTLVLNYVIEKYAAADPIGVTGAMATISIVWKTLGLSYTVIIGITAGAQPILGYNVGAEQWDRVLKCFRWACIDAIAVATVCWTVFMAVPQVALAPFNVGEDLLPFACRTMRIFGVWLPFVGYQMMGSSYFQSSGQAIKSAILELTRQFLFLIPLYLFFPPLAMEWFGVSGLTGVTLCVPISDVLAFVVTTAFVVVEVRRVRAKVREQKAAEAAGGAEGAEGMTRAEAATVAETTTTVEAASAAEAATTTA